MPRPYLFLGFAVFFLCLAGYTTVCGSSNHESEPYQGQSQIHPNDHQTKVPQATPPLFSVVIHEDDTKDTDNIDIKTGSDTPSTSASTQTNTEKTSSGSGSELIEPETVVSPLQHAEWVSLDQSQPLLGNQQGYALPVKNQKPQINLAKLNQLQNQIYQWHLQQGVAAFFQEPAFNVFEDPDGDPLSYRVDPLPSNSGLHVNYSGMITLSGRPHHDSNTSSGYTFRLSAKDSHHGDEESAWVNVQIELPLIEKQALDTVSPPHPLENKTLYRLETRDSASGNQRYEVVYCESVRFMDGNVYFAASNSLTTCPHERALKQVGRYQISQQQITITESDIKALPPQYWQLKRQYTSRHQLGVTNYLVTTSTGSTFETYTMQTQRSAMEARLHIVTGGDINQREYFDYYILDERNKYLPTTISNYIAYREEAQEIDSDLNIYHPNRHLHCEQFKRHFDFQVMAGLDMGGQVLKSSQLIARHCDVYSPTKGNPTQIIFVDMIYPLYQEFQPGNIYSYILRPLPEYAHIYEELKLNFIYDPDAQEPEE